MNDALEFSECFFIAARGYSQLQISEKVVERVDEVPGLRCHIHRIFLMILVALMRGWDRKRFCAGWARAMAAGTCEANAIRKLRSVLGCASFEYKLSLAQILAKSLAREAFAGNDRAERPFRVSARAQ